MHAAPLSAAAEYIDRERTLARDRSEQREAAARLCEVLELLDFTEWHLLHSPDPHRLDAREEAHDLAAD